LKYAAVLALVLGGSTQAAFAATKVIPLRVSAVVKPNCVLHSPIGLDFGRYDTAHQNGGPLDAVANALSIQCTRSALAVAISLDNGRSYWGSHRNLRDARSDLVAYEVYTAPDHATVWNAIQTVSYVPVTSQPASLALYGRVLPARTPPQPGHYSDTLTALVNF
jgi:spore coat protein U-like protein